MFKVNSLLAILTFGSIHGNVSQMFQAVDSVYERNLLLDKSERVESFLASHKMLAALVANMTPECALAIKCAIEAGQEHLFATDDIEGLRTLVGQLVAIQDYFHDLGGIIGYQEQVQALLHKESDYSDVAFKPPVGVDFTADSAQRRRAIRAGLKMMPQLAEIYPVGGAAERLKYCDKEGKRLPAAPLAFLGRSLLEGLVRDLKAREHLYEQVFGEKIETPVVLMTSSINNNHKVITDLLEKANYFGRSKESFFLFQQPLVPSFDKDGNWVLQEPGELLMKPGGHGVIWKLAIEKGALDWLKKQGRTKVLVRQINNPIAGTDFGLLALVGQGVLEDKKFGFASCERLVGASEGINVLKMVGDSSTISNIEYCDFTKYEICDAPRAKDDPYSLYPSNTNILFADVAALEEGALVNPYPGMLVNFKEGTARLESTMQNIADSFLSLGNQKTYITFNERRKTISTAKREYVEGQPIRETPYGCYIDYQKNTTALLAECGFSIPQSALFVYTPLLGPLYSVIGQKLSGGTLHEGSELQIDIADVLISGIDVNGSLLLSGDETGSSCVLRDVFIKNNGIDWDVKQELWSNTISRKEVCHIRLGVGSEFVAENITLRGDVMIDVPDNTRFRAVESDGEIILKEEPLTGRRWEYEINALDRICLKRSLAKDLLEKITPAKNLSRY